MYEHMSYEVILTRMLSCISPKMDKREGSIIYDAIAPAAIELSLMYIELDYILAETFGDTASREFLIRRARERNIIPYEASKALLKGVFEPKTVEIPLGARFSLNELNYEVSEKLSEGIYSLECEESGSRGNKNFGRIIPINYINGLKYAEITEILIPGEDEEDTEEFRKRYLGSFDSKAYGGNKRDYIEKVSAIAGVGAVKVTPVWNGGGTVKLTLLDSQYSPATDALILQVQEIIDPAQDALGDGVAPIGHIVTVESVTQREINIKADIYFRNGYVLSQMMEDIRDVVDGYFSELRRSWAEEEHLIIRISQIESRILSLTDVVDIRDTTINGMEENIILSPYEVPVLGEIEDVQ